MRLIFYHKGVSVWSPPNSVVLSVSSIRMKPHVLLDGIEYKHCSNCDTWHPLCNFHFFANSYDKLQAFCFSCNAVIHAGRLKKKIVPI